MPRLLKAWHFFYQKKTAFLSLVKIIRMRSIFYTFFLICIFLRQSNAQIVINEIMYNPPESGTDYLEYIEFYNAGTSPINLGNYKIPDAVVFTFPDTVLQAGSFILVTVDSIKLDSIFTVKALQWVSGGLRNTDEVISLVDAQGNLVDSVHYFSSWNATTNGNGASLELCRALVDNTQAVYWRASLSNAGKEVNGKMVFGSPGKANVVPCAEHSIAVSDFKFTPASLEIYVGEQVEWANQGGTHNVNGTQNVFPSNPMSFYSGAPSSTNWSFIQQFNTVGTYQYQCDVHASMGMVGTIRVKMKDVNYPDASIGSLRTYNQNGIVDSLDKRFTVEGTVYGVNLRPTGLQFTIIDQSGNGLGVFLSSGDKGYMVKETDLVRIKGQLTQFNGLAQINVDSIQRIALGAKLLTATDVTALNEETESALIRIKNVSLVDPLTWTNNPLGFTTKITDGINEFDLRIDNDVNVHGTMPPVGKFHVTGLGSQFDASSPFLDGYQIMPRYISDIEGISATHQAQQDGSSIYPTLVTDRIFIETKHQVKYLAVLDAQGHQLIVQPFSHVLDVPWTSGIYFLKLMGEHDEFFKFVKR